MEQAPPQQSDDRRWSRALSGQVWVRSEQVIWRMGRRGDRERNRRPWIAEGSAFLSTDYLAFVPASDGDRTLFHHVVVPLSVLRRERIREDSLGRTCLVFRVPSTSSRPDKKIRITFSNNGGIAFIRTFAQLLGRTRSLNALAMVSGGGVSLPPASPQGSRVVVGSSEGGSRGPCTPPPLPRNITLPRVAYFNPEEFTTVYVPVPGPATPTGTGPVGPSSPIASIVRTPPVAQRRNLLAPAA
mmetsp:Transcript_24310/g.39956  ORF Transcript_24310/g.39956 Transcript_24310/m.39956 type:complete len:242 (+) Transcript_24310:184-909(+)|eukprot:CAMPEP_0184645914 /NCGR_PEP_ID=MMETSP0308-20130426/2525_1 /TAXON_ID=38269 /ORGANISM="Gloeochaete witrockiana, Strain SAG 46.84" /LENGTH=241 /DNA_ID=CAMNT_0027075437 /DNA_START=158 /DNA_END=883 /DNA_ORIENTATION=-